jgi:D-sedoheptulose 7-phosphate isomerase
MSYSAQHLAETIEIAKSIDPNTIESIVDLLVGVKANKGRLFILGVGGSAANAGHAVNDFRKLAGIVFSEWLKVSKLTNSDCLFILSVGGGNEKLNVSTNLVRAIQFAKEVGAGVTGIIGRDGGYTAENSDICLIVPVVNAETVTPHSESFQAVIWHLLVSHPKLKSNATKW